jgi:hypothetical protein
VVVPAPAGPCATTEAPGSRSASMIAVTSADRPSIPGRAGEGSFLARRSRAATERYPWAAIISFPPAVRKAATATRV